VRVLRVYHAGRDPAHRARERALAAEGLDVALVVPHSWPESAGANRISEDAFQVVELPVVREGDVNRHAYREPEAIRRVVEEVRPDIVDLHEEPFSLAVHQWLRAVPPDLPVVIYTAQNVAKRYPPPFAAFERRAYARATAMYPCSRQAASVARGRGFAGIIRVIPLGFDPETFHSSEQSTNDHELTVSLVGRFVAEKGIFDAIRVLARLNKVRPARLTLVGSGPEEGQAHRLAESLGVADRLRIEPWASAPEVAAVYRRSHVVLLPSIATATWTEQFGRVIVEAQASGAVVAGYASGSIPEVAGDAAVLVPPGDVAALAEGLLQLVDDPVRYASLRDRGRALGAERTWKRVAAAQEQMYSRVLGGHGPLLELPRSPRQRRRLAASEFGPPATLTGGDRPFALPLLRGGGAVARFLEGAADVLAEARASTACRLARPRS
jgi:glycosyltransferase involved in cell wall biosynthesis